MANRNERPVFEGKNHRVDTHRDSDRRKLERYISVMKCLGVLVFIIIFVKIYSA